MVDFFTIVGGLMALFALLGVAVAIFTLAGPWVAEGECYMRGKAQRFFRRRAERAREREQEQYDIVPPVLSEHQRKHESGYFTLSEMKNSDHPWKKR